VTIVLVRVLAHHLLAGIRHLTEAKLAQGHSNATVNRTLELVRAVLRKCVNEWEWLDRAPQVRMLKEPTRRMRFLTRAEAQTLLFALPPHLADMAGFSLQTGCAHPTSPGSNGRGSIWREFGVGTPRSGEGAEGDTGSS
jgi:integrase